jgi:phosphoribosylformylglycinamidine synthase
MSGGGLFGADIDFKSTGMRGDVLLFNESQSRIVISVPCTNASAVLSLLEWRGVPARRIGTVGGDSLKIRADGNETSWILAELHKAWYSSISDAMSAN